MTKIIGIEGILDDFKQLQKDMDKAVNRKVRAGTNYMTRQLRAAVPDRDNEKNSGDLKKSIKSQVNGADGSVVTTAPHFHLVEYGTEERVHRSGKSVGRVKPSYFARDTIKRELPKVQSMIIEGVDEVFKGDF